MIKIKFCLVLLLFIFTFNSIAQSKQKPKIIGVVGTIENANNKFRSFPFYWIQPRTIDNFANACAGQNVSFVLLPLDIYQVKNLVNAIDGLVLSGGIETLNEGKRYEFENLILEEAIKQKKQIFGICRGFQFINYYFSKDEIKDEEILKSENCVLIEEHFKSNVKHKREKGCEYCGYFPVHKVKLDKRSKLAKILNKTEINVNSLHSYAINKSGKNVLVYGVSPEDGVPEMLEIKNYPKFLMGVQWHPEYLSTDDDVKLLQAFCKAVVENK